MTELASNQLTMDISASLLEPLITVLILTESLMMIWPPLLVQPFQLILLPIGQPLQHILKIKLLNLIPILRWNTWTTQVVLRVQAPTHARCGSQIGEIKTMELRLLLKDTPVLELKRLASKLLGGTPHRPLH